MVYNDIRVGRKYKFTFYSQLAGRNVQFIGAVLKKWRSPTHENVKVVVTNSDYPVFVGAEIIADAYQLKEYIDNDIRNL